MRNGHCLGSFEEFSARWERDCRLALTAYSRVARGFTLIELLIVIAIIAVLIGILLPALGGGRAQARMVQCMSNQRQIGFAQQSYADDFKELIIREAGGFACRTDDRYSMPWALAYRPYMDGSRSWEIIANDWFEDAPYYRDPARPDTDGHQIHYVNNGIGFERNDDGTLRYRSFKPMRTRYNIEFPSSVYYLTGYTEDFDNVNYNATYTPDETNWGIAIFYDARVPGHFRINERAPNVRRVEPNRHGKGANVLFLDGHAEFVRAEDMTDETNWVDFDYRYPDPGSSPGDPRHCPPGT